MGEPAEAQAEVSLVDRVQPQPRPANAVERALSAITERIVSGQWTPSSCPTVEQMSRQLGCGFGTLCKALRLAQERGLVHKVAVLLPPPGSRVWVWRPVGDPGALPEPSLVERLATRIRSGALTGPLPSIPSMARRYRVAQGAMQAAYGELVAERLLRRVWLPDFSRQVWHVLDGRQPAWLPPGEGTKADAIAADLVRRLPEWLPPEGTVEAVRALPPVEQLRKHYRTNWACLKEALDLLVAGGRLVEVPGSGRSRVAYLPVPEAAASDCLPGTFDLVDTEEL